MGPGRERNRRRDDANDDRDYVEWTDAEQQAPPDRAPRRRRTIGVAEIVVAAIVVTLAILFVVIFGEKDPQAAPAPTSPATTPIITAKPALPPSIPTGTTSPPPSADPISGNWLDNYGNLVKFEPTGPNSWSGEVIQGDAHICLPAHYRITGSGPEYKGTEAFYKRTTECGDYVGDGPFTMKPSPDGRSATIWSAPPGTVMCTNCGTFTWKKQ